MDFLTFIRSFFPPAIARESRFDRYMLKEYLQLLILDHLSTTPYFVTKTAYDAQHYPRGSKHRVLPGFGATKTM